MVPDAEAVLAVAHRAGLDVAGVAAAEPFATTRADLVARKEEGLSAGMHFTYSDPDAATDPARSLPGARALVVGARGYRRGAPAPPGPGPWGRVASYSWADEYHPLRAALEKVAEYLRSCGFSALVLVDDNRLVDREAARRAGLGWYGKNSVLLLPGRGSYFLLGSVVTDAPLSPTSEAPGDGCGSCSRCMTGCPTGALVRPGVVDANRCLAWVLQARGSFPRHLRRALGDRVYGCDECQDVCPFNRRRARAQPPVPPRPDDDAWVDLLWLLNASDGELIDRFGRWYIPRRQPRYVRRNALVALGNVADGDCDEVVAALRRCLTDADPLIRSHAVWAASCLGRGDLLRAMGGEDDDTVLEELEAAGART
ncbi:MAG TPA: tRNA epoxyqueuosine(34) reductase QueG [Acidimicrobiales bacterium]|nr:tRNA epoxyqueuosine(34) reductase QueG [Acidimicrobiales bacterium]